MGGQDRAVETVEVGQESRDGIIPTSGESLSPSPESKGTLVPYQEGVECDHLRTPTLRFPETLHVSRKGSTVSVNFKMLSRARVSSFFTSVWLIEKFVDSLSLLRSKRSASTLDCLYPLHDPLRESETAPKRTGSVLGEDGRGCAGVDTLKWGRGGYVASRGRNLFLYLLGIFHFTFLGLLILVIW